MSTPLFNINEEEAVVYTMTKAELTNKLAEIIDDVQGMKESLNRLHAHVANGLESPTNGYNLNDAVKVFKSLVDIEPSTYAYVRDLYLEAVDEALKITQAIHTDSGEVDVQRTIRAVCRTLRERTIPNALVKKYPVLLQLEHV